MAPPMISKLSPAVLTPSQNLPVGLATLRMRAVEVMVSIFNLGARKDLVASKSTRQHTEQLNCTDAGGNYDSYTSEDN